MAGIAIRIGRTIHDHEKDGWLTFAEIISHSSNIGTAKVALKMGPDTLFRYARAFVVKKTAGATQ